MTTAINSSQTDRRLVSGGRVPHRLLGKIGPYAVENALGVQLRRDSISNVGLQWTAARHRLSTIRSDAVGQTSVGTFIQTDIQWAPRFRTLIGLRGDLYHFNVRADNPANSGAQTDGLLSPKASAIIGPWSGSEMYLSVGLGFYSNDARGAEIGLGSVRIPGVQSTVSLMSYMLPDK